MKASKLGRFYLLVHLSVLCSLILGSFGPAAAGPAMDDTPAIPETLIEATPAGDQAPSNEASPHTIHLQSRQFRPAAPDVQELDQLKRSDGGRVHLLVQLDFIPRQAAKDALAVEGLELLAYVPDYAWIASADAGDPAGVLELPGVTWAGRLTADDKLDPAIRADQWGSWNASSDGSTVAVYVALHSDEKLETGQALAAAHGGQVTGEVIGINLLMVEMAKENVPALAAEEAVMWIEPAAPPLGEANDGIRVQIGVDTLQTTPYNLDGTGIDVLVYDSGQAGDHVDFGTRLRHGDADTVSYHSTHVAGTIGGNGSNSANQGGTALQWRGMAPNVDLLSYGTQGYGTGDILFYNNVPDIEADFATAQNSYGADLANGSLGSNIYDNDPEDCWVMGKYGSASLLLDQIIRGGNSVVGIGDRYITAWAAGNERNSAGSCSDTYNSIAPPAAAKNPIHVGASNTNNNTMTTFSSWGPTEDGRIKPIVVAGGEQTTGDFGIKSTDNDPVNTYLVLQGTSMATPAVSGLIALMLEHYRDVYSTSGNFWPSTAKAILMQTADDFGNPGPDYQWGYGQVDGVAAIELITRQAFRQESINQGEVDVFYFAVQNDADPVTVSLAWDDYEATFNANPTLINNLNLELVSPDGTLWRPWILNPALPANNATRGVDNRNNQEQVQVTLALEPNLVGTWMVRVRGTTVPQGPQSYSLACEGCRPLNLGVCQYEVTGSRAPADPAALDESGTMDASQSQVEAQPLTAGELWQRSLEAPMAAEQDAELVAGLTAIEAAINQGPEAVIALQETLRGPALELAANLIAEAHQQLAPQPAAPADPNRPAATLTVGPSCTYSTIQAAVNAAGVGDSIWVAQGVYFENVDIINQTVTIEGGYNNTCTTPGAGVTRVEGSLNPDSTIDISSSTVTLRNLEIAWGVDSFGGAGIIALSGSVVTLDNADVFNNHGAYGGGIYISIDSVMTTNNGSEIHDNTATLYGGGARVWGEFSAFSNESDIHDNCAGHGGGFDVPGGILLLNAADTYLNEAANTDGQGGGIRLTSGGTVTLLNAAYVYYHNQAYNGAGVYAHASAVDLQGGSTTLRDNLAANDGGAIYLTNGSTLTSTGSRIGQAGSSLPNEALRGAGIFATDSTINFSGEIINNVALSYGGGIYADSCTLNLSNTAVGGRADYVANQLTADGAVGAGLYLTGTLATLNNTVVSSNDFQGSGLLAGGGAYLQNSTMTLTNSTVELHSAAPASFAGIGGGIIAGNSTVTLDNTQVISNTAQHSGGGIWLYGGSTLNVLNSSSIRHNEALSSNGGGIGATQAADVNLQDTTLQYNSAALDGGAVWIDDGTLDFTGWWDLRWNDAGSDGGAIAIAGTADADLYATTGPCYLVGNTATGNGGAIYLGNNSTVQLHSTSGHLLSLNGNTATGDGGALVASSSGYLDIYGQVEATANVAGGNGGLAYLSAGSRIWLDDYVTVRPQVLSNQADSGGAIYAVDSPSVQLDGVDLGTDPTGNQATAGNGGAIYVNNSTLDVDNCTFRNGRATGHGGAIAAFNSTVDIQASFTALGREMGDGAAPLATGCNPSAGPCSAFYANTADSDANTVGSGGALYLSESALTLDYTHLFKNSSYTGGALYQAGAAATADVRNTLIYSNTVTLALGAGIRASGGAMTVTHTTLANNVGGAGYSQASTTSRAYNSIAWGNGVGGFLGTFAAASCNIDQSNNAGSNVDPRFISPGAGEDYHLQSDSPAIDACVSGLTPDLDNVARPVGDNYDMGAYENSIKQLYLPLVIQG